MDSKSPIEKSQIQNSLLAKYKCTKYYYQTLDCAKRNIDDPKLCDEDIKKIGECLYNGMLLEERKQIS
jgi:hypothetical protein